LVDWARKGTDIKVEIRAFASKLLQSCFEAESENLGSIELKLIDLCLQPAVLFIELVSFLLEPAVFFTSLSKLRSSFS